MAFKSQEEEGHQDENQVYETGDYDHVIDDEMVEAMEFTVICE